MGTNIRVFAVVIAARVGFSSLMVVGPFRRRKREGPGLHCFWFFDRSGSFMSGTHVSWTRGGCASLPENLSFCHFCILFTQLLTGSVFLKDAGKTVALKLSIWHLVQYQRKWTRVPLSEICPHEEIISAVRFESRSEAAIRIVPFSLRPRIITLSHSRIPSVPPVCPPAHALQAQL